jgi:hypothetical protein
LEQQLTLNQTKKKSIKNIWEAWLFHENFKVLKKVSRVASNWFSKLQKWLLICCVSLY